MPGCEIHCLAHENEEEIGGVIADWLLDPALMWFFSCFPSTATHWQWGVLVSSGFLIHYKEGACSHLWMATTNLSNVFEPEAASELLLFLPHSADKEMEGESGKRIYPKSRSKITTKTGTQLPCCPICSVSLQLLPTGANSASTAPLPFKWSCHFWVFLGGFETKFSDFYVILKHIPGLAIGRHHGCRMIPLGSPKKLP